MTLKAKLLAATLGLSIIPVVVVASIVFVQTRSAFDNVVGTAEEGMHDNAKLAKDALIEAKLTDLEHVATDVYHMCRAQQELLEQKLAADLSVARDVVQQTGPVSFADETVSWTAVNQYTMASQSVELPKMQIGDMWLGQVSDAGQPAPIVDRVHALVGGTCTVFQRMNAAGDMLRVCTNVIKGDGGRAVGTYIPAVNPDGQPNPVLATVLKGQTFTGRAYVVNDWYITAYEPIVDAAKNVVGVLYVGVKEQSTKSLREAIMSIAVGNTGYVYVLGGSGTARGHYIISKDGKRDGEDIWNTKDADGRLFIQDICNHAIVLRPGEIIEERYPWQNVGEAQPREKVVKVAYFAPWDWVIGVGAYEDEFYEAVHQMDAQAAANLAKVRDNQQSALALVLYWSVGIALATAFVGLLVAMMLVRGISKPITRIIDNLANGAARVTEAASQVSSASQQLAESASEQASSLEETSSALEQMSAMTRTNAENSKQANELSNQARYAAETGDQTMARLNGAMVAINESAGQISKIIKVIEEIAFQTNLLALNAAVEAARAGEHGKGFAVVAEEVRNLAMRAAEAARETTGLIEASVVRAKEGSEVAGEVGESLSRIVGDVTRVSELIDGISRASEEQAQGVEQVNTAVSQMDKVTQSNAAGAEQSASAAEELSAQAVNVHKVVDELAVLVGGRRAQQRMNQKRDALAAHAPPHHPHAHASTHDPAVHAKHPAPYHPEQDFGAGVDDGPLGKF